MGLDVQIGKRVWHESEEDDEYSYFDIEKEWNESSPIHQFPSLGDNWWAGSYIGTHHFFEEVGLWDWILSVSDNQEDYPCTKTLTPDMLQLLRDARMRYQGGDDYYAKCLRWFEFWMYYAISKYGAEAAIRLH